MAADKDTTYRIFVEDASGNKIPLLAQKFESVGKSAATAADKASKALAKKVTAATQAATAIAESQSKIITAFMESSAAATANAEAVNAAQNKAMLASNRRTNKILRNLTQEMALIRELHALQAKGTGIGSDVNERVSLGGKAGTISSIVSAGEKAASVSTILPPAKTVSTLDGSIRSSADRLKENMANAELWMSSVGSKQSSLIAAEKERAAAIAEGTKGIKSQEVAASSLGRTMERIQRTVAAFVAVWAFQKITSGLSQMVKGGLDFNSVMEESKLGMAAIFMAQGDFVAASGRALEGTDALNASMELSSDISKKLQLDNLKTAATYQQLVKAYQQTIAPGLAVGFDPEQIRNYTVGMVQAASALGLNLDLLAEETRSMLKGTITPRNTLIATALGIRNEDINKYKGDVDGLYKYVMGRLSAFGVAGEAVQLTWKGSMSNAKDVVQIALGEGFTNLFDYLKGQALLLQKSMVNWGEDGPKINPEVVAVFASMGQAIIEIIEGTKTWARSLSGLLPIFGLIYQILRTIGLALTPFVEMLGVAVTAVGRLAGALSKVLDGVNDSVSSIRSVQIALSVAYGSLVSKMLVVASVVSLIGGKAPTRLLQIGASITSWIVPLVAIVALFSSLDNVLSNTATTMETLGSLVNLAFTGIAVVIAAGIIPGLAATVVAFATWAIPLAAVVMLITDITSGLEAINPIAELLRFTFITIGAAMIAAAGATSLLLAPVTAVLAPLMVILAAVSLIARSKPAQDIGKSYAKNTGYSEYAPIEGIGFGSEGSMAPDIEPQIRNIEFINKKSVSEINDFSSKTKEAVSATKELDNTLVEFSNYDWFSNLTEGINSFVLNTGEAINKSVTWASTFDVMGELATSLDNAFNELVLSASEFATSLVDAFSEVALILGVDKFITDLENTFNELALGVDKFATSSGNVFNELALGVDDYIVSLSEIKIPDLEFPDIKLPDLKFPDVKLPDLKFPDVKLSNLELPDIKLPNINVEIFDVKSFKERFSSIVQEAKSNINSLYETISSISKVSSSLYSSASSKSSSLYSSVSSTSSDFMSSFIQKSKTGLVSLESSVHKFFDTVSSSNKMLAVSANHFDWVESGVKSAFNSMGRLKERIKEVIVSYSQFKDKSFEENMRRTVESKKESDRRTDEMNRSVSEFVSTPSAKVKAVTSTGIQESESYQKLVTITTNLVSKTQEWANSLSSADTRFKSISKTESFQKLNTIIDNGSIKINKFSSDVVSSVSKIGSEIKSKVSFDWAETGVIKVDEFLTKSSSSIVKVGSLIKEAFSFRWIENVAITIGEALINTFENIRKVSSSISIGESITSSFESIQKMGSSIKNSMKFDWIETGIKKLNEFGDKSLETYNLNKAKHESKYTNIDEGVTSPKEFELSGYKKRGNMRDVSPLLDPIEIAMMIGVGGIPEAKTAVTQAKSFVSYLELEMKHLSKRLIKSPKLDEGIELSFKAEMGFIKKLEKEKMSLVKRDYARADYGERLRKFTIPPLITKTSDLKNALIPSSKVAASAMIYTATNEIAPMARKAASFDWIETGTTKVENFVSKSVALLTGMKSTINSSVSFDWVETGAIKVDEFLTSSSSSLVKVGSLIKEAFSFQWIEGVATNIGQFLIDSYQYVSKTSNEIRNLSWSGIASSASEIATSVKSSWSNVFDSIQKGVSDSYASISEINLESSVTEISDEISNIFKSISEIDLESKINDEISSISKSMSEIDWASSFTEISDEISNTFKSLEVPKTVVIDIDTNLGTILDDVPNKISSLVSSFKDSMGKIRSYIEGVSFAGLIKKFDDFIDKINKWATATPETKEKELPTNIPNKSIIDRMNTWALAPPEILPPVEKETSTAQKVKAMVDKSFGYVPRPPKLDEGQLDELMKITAITGQLGKEDRARMTMLNDLVPLYEDASGALEKQLTTLINIKNQSIFTGAMPKDPFAVQEESLDSFISKLPLYKKDMLELTRHQQELLNQIARKYEKSVLTPELKIKISEERDIVINKDIISKEIEAAGVDLQIASQNKAYSQQIYLIDEILQKKLKQKNLDVKEDPIADKAARKEAAQQKLQITIQAKMELLGWSEEIASAKAQMAGMVGDIQSVVRFEKEALEITIEKARQGLPYRAGKEGDAQRQAEAEKRRKFELESSKNIEKDILDYMGREVELRSTLASFTSNYTEQARGILETNRIQIRNLELDGKLYGVEGERLKILMAQTDQYKAQDTLLQGMITNAKQILDLRARLATAQGNVEETLTINREQLKLDEMPLLVELERIKESMKETVTIPVEFKFDGKGPKFPLTTKKVTPISDIKRMQQINTQIDLMDKATFVEEGRTRIDMTHAYSDALSKVQMSIYEMTGNVKEYESAARAAFNVEIEKAELDPNLKANTEQLDAYLELLREQFELQEKIRKYNRTETTLKLKSEVSIQSGSWDKSKLVEKERLTNEFNKTMETGGLEGKAKEYAEEIYLYKLQEIEAQRTFNTEKLTEIGLQQYSLKVAADLANSIQTLIPSAFDAAGSALSTFTSEMIMGTTSIKDAFRNMMTSVSQSFSRLISDMIVQWLKAKLMMGFAAAATSGGAGISTSGAVGSGVLKVAEGGLIGGKGTGTSDSNLAYLSKGEFVINAAQTQKYLPMLQNINNGTDVDYLNCLPKMKDGGMFGKVMGSSRSKDTETNLLNQYRVDANKDSVALPPLYRNVDSASIESASSNISNVVDMAKFRDMKNIDSSVSKTNEVQSALNTNTNNMNNVSNVVDMAKFRDMKNIDSSVSKTNEVQSALNTNTNNMNNVSNVVDMAKFRDTKLVSDSRKITRSENDINSVIEFGKKHSVPMRASGGPVSSGLPYIVGEEGPELFVPSSPGSIMPNMGTVNSKQDIKIDINVPVTTVEGGSSSSGSTGTAGMDKTMGIELGRKIRSAVTEVIQEQKRAGGILSGR